MEQRADKRIEIAAEMTAMSAAHPIRMVHRRTPDKPENHMLHINNYIEIYIFVSGDHRYIVENELYDLRRGDIIVINPLEVHKALPLSEVEYERFYFLVDVDTFSAMSKDPLAAILRKPSGFGNLISFDNKTREGVLARLYEISECFVDGKDDQLRALGLFLQVLDDINGRLRETRAEEKTPTHAPELLKRILAYVTDRAATLRSTGEVARAMGITPQYLSSYFSKHIGTSLKHYIQAKRIALAKELLDGGADVTEACYECGFGDCSYFIRVFKRHVGATPLAYKQRYGNEKQKEG